MNVTKNGEYEKIWKIPLSLNFKKPLFSFIKNTFSSIIPLINVLLFNFTSKY